MTNVLRSSSLLEHICQRYVQCWFKCYTKFGCDSVLFCSLHLHKYSWRFFALQFLRIIISSIPCLYLVTDPVCVNLCSILSWWNFYLPDLANCLFFLYYKVIKNGHRRQSPQQIYFFDSSKRKSLKSMLDVSEGAVTSYYHAFIVVEKSKY